MLGQYLLLLLAVTTVNCCAPNSPRRPLPRPQATTPLTKTAPMPCGPFGEITEAVYNVRFPGAFAATAAPPQDNFRVTCPTATPTIYYTNDAREIAQANAIQCTGGQWMATNTAGGAPVTVAFLTVRCAPAPIPCGPFGDISEPLYMDQIGAGFDMTAAPPPDNMRVTCPPTHPTLYYVNDAREITQANAIQCTGGQWMATNTAGGAPVTVAFLTVRCAPVPMLCVLFGEITEPLYTAQIGAGFDMTAAPLYDIFRVICPPTHPTLYYVNDAREITQANAIQCTGGQWMATNTNGMQVVVANPMVRCAPVPTPCGPFGEITEAVYNVRFPGAFAATAAPPEDHFRVTCPRATPTIYYVNDARVITQANAIQCTGGQWMATNTNGMQVVVANPMVRCAPVPTPCGPFGEITEAVYNVRFPGAFAATAAPPEDHFRVTCPRATPTIYYVNDARVITQANAIQCTGGQWMATNTNGMQVVVANPIVRCAPVRIPCGAVGHISDVIYNGQFGAGSFAMTAAPPQDNFRVTCPPTHPTLYYVNDARVITQANAIQCTGGQWMATNTNGMQVAVAFLTVRCAPVPMPCGPFGEITEAVYNVRFPGAFAATAAPPEDHFRVTCPTATPTIYYVDDARVITQANAIQCTGGQWMATNTNGMQVVVANPIVRCAPVRIPCGAVGHISDVIYNGQFGAGSFAMTAAPPQDNFRVTCPPTHPTLYYVNDARVITQANAIQCTGGQWMATNTNGMQVAVAFLTVRCAPVPMPCGPFGEITEAVYNVRFPGAFAATAAPPEDHFRVTCPTATPTIYYVDDDDEITQANAIQCTGGQWIATNTDSSRDVVVNPMVRCAPVPIPCGPFGEITEAVYNVRFPGAFAATAAPPEDHFRVTCPTATPTIYYVNDDDEITQANAIQCTGGQWIATNTDSSRNVVVNPMVRCAPVIPCGPFGQITEAVYNVRFPGAFAATAAPPQNNFRVTCPIATPTIYYVNDARVITQANMIKCSEGQWEAINTNGMHVAVAFLTVRCAPRSRG